MASIQADLVVLGSGPGGYSAAYRAADLGLNVVLIERYPNIGGVCLNVGCIPSKALLHAAKVMAEAKDMSEHGIEFGEPKINLDKLRGWKDSVVNQLTTGLKGMAKMRKVQIVEGVGRFTSDHAIEVTHKKSKQVVEFKQAIIAAGSRPIQLPFIPEDPRIVDSTGALELRDIPKKMLVIGGGIIGLEMATVYSALGSQITVVELMDQLMNGVDPDVAKVYQKQIQDHYDIKLETKVVGVKAKSKGIEVTFEGKNAPEKPQLYDRVLVGVGRVPNGHDIGADKAGVEVNERGFIPVDQQQKTNVPHIFAIGDIVGQPMLAHKAVPEGRLAAEVAAGKKHYFDPITIPSVAYTDPEVSWCGLTEAKAKAEGIPYEKGVFPWAACGRSLSQNRNEGMTKLLFDPKSKRLLGATIIGTNAGDLISEMTLALEMGADAEDIALTIHPHPTLAETMMMAAEVFEGTATDLPPVKKKK